MTTPQTGSTGTNIIKAAEWKAAKMNYWHLPWTSDTCNRMFGLNATKPAPCDSFQPRYLGRGIAVGFRNGFDADGTKLPAVCVRVPSTSSNPLDFGHYVFQPTNFVLLKPFDGYSSINEAQVLKEKSYKNNANGSWYTSLFKSHMNKAFPNDFHQPPCPLYAESYHAVTPAPATPTLGGNDDNEEDDDDGVSKKLAFDSEKNKTDEKSKDKKKGSDDENDDDDETRSPQNSDNENEKNKDSTEGKKTDEKRPKNSLAQEAYMAARKKMQESKWNKKYDQRKAQWFAAQTNGDINEDEGFTTPSSASDIDDDADEEAQEMARKWMNNPSNKYCMMHPSHPDYVKGSKHPLTDKVKGNTGK